MALHVTHQEWNDLTEVDETTYKTSKIIQGLAAGLTPKQFADAISIALDAISRYSILSIPPVPKSD